ncbi:MAG TPA: hypothetical protein VF742_00415, partial [Terracidiphilus sp.]
MLIHRLLVRALLVALIAMAAGALVPAQERMTPGHSIGTVTTHGNLIILSLDENALGKSHFFDLAHRTVRFTPEGARYRAEALPEAWDNEFGTEMKDPRAKLSKLTFP